MSSSPSGETSASRLRLPERPESPQRAILLRVFVALSVVAITTFVVWIDREGYSNVPAGKPLTLLDCFYYATVTLSTTGYGDISPVSEGARLVNIIVDTPLRFLFLIVLVGTTLEVLTRRAREQSRVEKWKKTVSEHTVIIGFGVKGRSAAKSLLASGTPANKLVVVVNDDESGAEAHRMGLHYVKGDGRREDILREAEIEKAKRVVVATDADDTSVLVTLTASRLAPDAKIVSAARESLNAQILRDSGAEGVIVTAEAAGRLLSMRLESPAAGDLMEDLLDSSAGLEVVEREVHPEELGLSPDDLEALGEKVLAVIRDGAVNRFDEHQVRLLQKEDHLVVIRDKARGRRGA